LYSAEGQAIISEEAAAGAATGGPPRAEFLVDDHALNDEGLAAITRPQFAYVHHGEGGALFSAADIMGRAVFFL